MSVNTIYKSTRFLSCAFLLLSSFSLFAAQQQRYNYDASTAMRESIDTLRHEINNHETELRMFEERVNNQESTISSLRQQVLDVNQANKDLVKGNSSSMESKLSHLESANKGFIADLQLLQKHANESATALGQLKQRLIDLEKASQAQNQNIENLHAALKSLTEVLSVKEGGSLTMSGKSYTIKAGDSLEKIARAHNTTIKAIKQLNNLTSDKIVVGKTIQIP